MNRAGFLQGVAALATAAALGRSMQVADILAPEGPILVARAQAAGAVISANYAQHIHVGDILRYTTTGEVVRVTAVNPITFGRVQ